MNRHYYISDNLDDLERVEFDLQERGVSTPQLHVFSPGDGGTIADVEAHHLHEVTDFTKSDVVHSGMIGLGIGAIAACLVLLLAHFLGWAETAAGWTPFIFLAIVFLGFSAWEGGLRGIQEPNQEFVHFKDALDAGKHIFFIDVEAKQEHLLKEVVDQHPQLEFAGDGSAAPAWIVKGQSQFQRFIKAMP